MSERKHLYIYTELMKKVFTGFVIYSMMKRAPKNKGKNPKVNTTPEISQKYTRTNNCSTQLSQKKIHTTRILKDIECLDALLDVKNMRTIAQYLKKNIRIYIEYGGRFII